MKEQEYIILSNKVKIADAIKILNEVLLGTRAQYGVNHEMFADALTNLDRIHNLLTKQIKIDEQDG